MTAAHVLIVEDETKIAQLLQDYFEHAGYRVDVAHRGDVVESMVARDRPDLVVLDLQLPGLDGLDVCRRLRAMGPDPAIMMVTARIDEVDRLIGLELGADDYVCKPFSPREVVVRAKAILRRMRPMRSGESTLRIGPISVDLIAHTAQAEGHDLNLTPIEFALMEAMLEQPRRVWSRAQLLERAKGTDFAGYERNIDGHVKNLRRKLRDSLGGREPIRSVYGVGYGLDADVLGDDGGAAGG